MSENLKFLESNKTFFSYENPLELSLEELSWTVVLVEESSLVPRLAGTVVHLNCILDLCIPLADVVVFGRPNRDKNPRHRLRRQLSPMSRHPKGWPIITSSFNEIFLGFCSKGLEYGA